MLLLYVYLLTEGIADRFVLDDGRSETVQVLKQ